MDFHKKRKSLFLLGCFLVLIAFVCNVWVLAAIFSPDGALLRPTRILIWSFDISCLIAGFIVLYRRNVLVLLQLAIFLVSLLIFLAIANWYLGSRIFAEFYLHRKNPHGTGSYRLIPNLDLVRKIGRTTYVIKTNSHGMHWREVSLKKPKGAIRVAFVGDSFTFGCCSDTVKNSFVGVFDSHISKFGYETLNFGTPGYGLADEELQIREDVLRFKPDFLILVVYTGNDFSETLLSLDSQNRVRETPDRRMFINSPEFPPTAQEGFSRKAIRSISDSAIFFLLGSLFEKEEEQNVPSVEFQVEQDFNSRTYWSQTPYPAIATRSVERYVEILERIHQVCADNQIRLILMSIPFKEQVYATRMTGPDYDIRRPQNFIEAFAQRKSIPYIDTLPVLREYVRKEKRAPYFETDPHFNQDGHAVLGKYVAAFFLEKLPAGRSR